MSKKLYLLSEFIVVDGCFNANKKGCPDKEHPFLIFICGNDYQTLALKLSGRYILSPGLTPKAA